MKKLILIVLALSFVGGVAFTSYDEGSLIHNKETSKGSAADPVRVYQLVRYAEGKASSRSLSAGEVVVWDSVSDDGVTVGLAGTAGSTDAVAGVLVGTIRTSDNASSAANSIGSRNWGWVQTYGPCSSAMVKSTTAEGQAIAADDANAGYATPIASSGTAGAGDARGTSAFGFALDAVSSSAQDVEIFVKNR